jgi:NPCBM/NEW2 domain
MRRPITCFEVLGPTVITALFGVACSDAGGLYSEDLESSSQALLTEKVTYVSDLEFVAASNGWGPVERDRSNGETGAADGRTIRLNGLTHTKGLGVHASSNVTLDLGAQYDRFEADVGVDDEAGLLGSVTFTVVGDGRVLSETGVLTGASPTQKLTVSVKGVRRLELRVGDGGNGRSWDHADWASARLVKVVDVAPPPAPTPTPTPIPTPPPPPAPPATGKCQLGHNASLNGRQVFPASSEWRRDISGDPVDPNSQNYINSIGAATTIRPDFGREYEGAPMGIQYVVVPGNQARVPVRFDVDDESDPGPYPFPMNAPIEGGPDGEGDRHIIAVDCDNGKIYETHDTWPASGSFDAFAGAIFNMDTETVRPKGWTSADAAGLSVFGGLVRYDEVVERGEINHALRFTVKNSQRAYVFPATHFASTKTDPNLPPMGMRVRLKASFDISGYPKEAQVILRALKKYGMFMADNGADWFLSGAPNPQWNEDALATLRRVKGSDFEVVKMGPITR